jgi:hypothetical protein
VGRADSMMPGGVTSLTIPILLMKPVSIVGCSGGACLACTPHSQIGCEDIPCGSSACCDPGNNSCVLAGAACSSASTVCAHGTCSACGGQGQPCCTGGMCNSSECCDPSHNSCVLAGAACSNAGTVCAHGTCGACGGQGQPCCTGGMCSSSGCCDRSAGAVGDCIANLSQCANGTSTCIAGSGCP